jgi:mono/diheme cytochrome c family protein
VYLRGAVFLLLSLSGCGFYQSKIPIEKNATPSNVALKVSYAMVHNAVFAPRCVSCHGTSGGVNLETYSNVKVHLSAIERTALLDKTMPKVGALASSEISLLTAWIQTGAPEYVTSSTIPEGVPTPSPTSGVSPLPIPSEKLTYALMREKVFAPRCIACHGNSGGINLESYSMIKENLNWILIATLVEHTMPKNGSLTPNESELLTLWVKAGAPETASGTPPPVEEPLQPTFTSIKKKIFDLRCISCHKAGGAALGVPLQTRKDLLDSPRDLVLPGNPDESGLLIALTRKDSKRMPPPTTASSLSDAELGVVRKWISDGAKE